MPVFAVLVGLATRDRARAPVAALSRSSGHFLDVVRACRRWSRYRRAERAVGDDPRGHRPLPPAPRWTRCGLAFASSAVLELVATLSVALVAVTVGLRLAAGSTSTSGPR